VFLALRNPTDGTRSCTLTVEPAGFGRDPARLAAATDALASQPVMVTRSQANLLLKLTVPAHDTAIVRLDWSG
jgi:hypothetical protein